MVFLNRVRNGWWTALGLALFSGLLWPGPAKCQLPPRPIFEPAPQSFFEQALALQDGGMAEAAFLKFLSEPGGEYAAVVLARPKAREFLALLRKQGAAIPVPRAKLIEGDLLLTLKDKAGALTCYREVASHIAVKENEGWAQGLLPRADYFVEPTPEARHPNQYYSSGPPSRSPLSQPFTIGPGSHRDNWLLRRFIALEAWPEAGQEFERIWQLHREESRPHLVVGKLSGLSRDFHNNEHGVQQQAVAAPKPTPSLLASQEPLHVLVKPAGFNSFGLRFALDYAFFLARRNDAVAARKVLLEPFLLIDLDRNPQFPSLEPIPANVSVPYPNRDVRTARTFLGYILGHGASPADISRKEFIRLAFAEFKTANQEAALISAIESRIKPGKSPLRRLLARVYLHQGRVDDALALELAYIDLAKFDPLSAAYRRGVIYDEFQKVPEAASELEKIWTLQFVPPNLPDVDEEGAPRQLWPSLTDLSPGAASRAMRREDLTSNATYRLLRLYTALGDTEKILALTLKQLEAHPQLLSQFGVLDGAAQRFRASGQEPRFKEWATRQLDTTKAPAARATLQWVAGDFEAAAETVALDANLQQSREWTERFRAAGPTLWKPYLRRLVVAFPENSQLRLELLELEGNLNGPDAIPVLEQLLDSKAEPAFARGKGSRNRTQFTSYYDLGYRLMRLYEKYHEPEKLHSLGIRIARAEKPFPAYARSVEQYRDGNGMFEDATASLNLAIQQANTTEQLIALSLALKDSSWDGPKAQVARRLAAPPAGPLPPNPATLAEPQPPGIPLPGIVEPEPFGWANLPNGVQLIASNENVLAVAHDDNYLYSGHPWGVAVYDLNGAPVTRIALDEAASCIVCLAGKVWVGSPKGLFRITRETGEVAHQWLHDDIPVKQRQTLIPRAGNRQGYTYENSVSTLAADGDLLWIGMHRNIQVLNTKTLELQAFTFEELKIENWADFDRIVPDGQYVWADGRSGLRRFDRTTGEWSAFERPLAPEHVHFLDIIDGQVYGNVHMNNALGIRPCRIDRSTLAVTPLSFKTRERDGGSQDPMKYFGKWNGQMVFGPHRPSVVFDDKAGEMKPLSELAANQLHALLPDDQLDSRLRIAAANSHRMFKFDRMLGRPDAGDWHALTLPQSSAVPVKDQVPKESPKVRLLGHQFGQRGSNQPYDDWPDQYHDVQEQDGGLYLVADGAIPRRISGQVRPDTLANDYIFSMFTAGEQAWLCTSLGLAKINSAGDVEDQFTRSEGLCANGITTGVELGGKLYFATAWGDSGGGLMVFDPQTACFTSWHSSDGMSTDKLESISVADGHLNLTYATEYLRGRSQGEFSYRQFPPGQFDPRTNLFTSGGPERLLKQNEAESKRWKLDREPQPYLGGFLNQRVTWKGNTYLCGTRGLVIVEGEGDQPLPALTIAPLGAKLIQSENVKLLADAELRNPRITSHGELAKAMRDPNPYYRAQAMASLRSAELNSDHFHIFAGQLGDSNLRVRSTALYLLAQIKTVPAEVALPKLSQCLKDRDPRLRTFAALEMIRRGQLLPLRSMQSIREESEYGHVNLPFGAWDHAGVGIGAQAFDEAVAALATPEVFAMMLKKFPPNIEAHDNRTHVFPQLGKSLIKYPQAADVLLKSRDRDFSRNVFHFAGTEMLPVLHKALQSDDRVIRSNAARACGAIADPSSIAPLIKSLELESGLSRASSVWALGELRAKEALPAFAKLYVDAQNDEQRRGGSGFRGGQASAAMSAQFDDLTNRNTLEEDWDNPRDGSQDSFEERMSREDLLTPGHILEAIGKIGSAESQDFYRALAADKDLNARKEAAEHLANCAASDQPQNIRILRNLLADPDFEVSLRAATSLLILGNNEGQTALTKALDSNREHELSFTLMQLSRVRQSDRLEFAQPRLNLIAKDPYLGEGTLEVARKLLK